MLFIGSSQSSNTVPEIIQLSAGHPVSGKEVPFLTMYLLQYEEILTEDINLNL